MMLLFLKTTYMSKRLAHLFFILMTLSLTQEISAEDNLDRKNHQRINIEITSHLGDQQVFVENDIISFFISLDHAAYIYVFYQDASNNVYQLLPNKTQTKHYFNAGDYIPFPAQDSDFQFKIRPPFGKEQLWVFASDQKQTAFMTSATSDKLRPIIKSQGELGKTIRLKSAKLFGQAQLTINTRKK